MALEQIPEAIRHAQVEDSSTLFKQIISEPLQDVDHSSHMVVVLDALDECEERGALKTIIDQWDGTTPSWLGLVLSTRPEVPIAGDEVLAIDDERQAEDVRHCIRVRLKGKIEPADDIEQAVQVQS